ncbi:MAG TPA: PqqD family protein [Actinomycetota bacterium]|nr:PqqD family protein [Actinomycetota bacterium]
MEQAVNLGAVESALSDPGGILDDGGSNVIDESTMIRRSPRVEFRELGEEGGAVLLHLGTGAYHGTNEVGALIWQLLGDDGLPFGVLVEQLRAQLDDVPDDMESEISEFLDDLASRELILREDAAVS